jgi:dipeptidase D
MNNSFPGRIDPVFSTLEPAAVWAHFSALCRIPRQSKAEGGLRDEIQNWALARGLSATVDAAGNLLLRKAASRGMEEAPGVVLQAHLDMVCEKNAGSAHDFSRDPIRPLCARRLAARRGDDAGSRQRHRRGPDPGRARGRLAAHGPLEALLTVDEEAGMGGAHGLQGGLLQGRLLLNLDTEEWGEFYLGCAGGSGRQCAPRWSRGSSASRSSRLGASICAACAVDIRVSISRAARQRDQTAGARAA